MNGVARVEDPHPHERHADLYAATRVRVMIRGAWREVPDAARALGAFHVITAWNPGDERPSREVNDRANEALRADLVAAGCAPVPAIGSDPASDHAEESWAVTGLSDAQACALGRKYGQWAVFRIDADAQTVVGCFGEWSRSRRYDGA